MGGDQMKKMSREMKKEKFKRCKDSFKAGRVVEE